MTKWTGWMGAAAVAFSALLAGSSQARAQASIDGNLPIYRPANTLSGELTLVGSDAMTQLSAIWSEEFRKFYPQVKINLVSASSTRSVQTIQDGSADFALMSREVLPEEIAAYKQATGHDPQIVISSMERIAVLVNKNNPIEGVTLANLDALFSVTHKRGGPEIKTWGDLGVQGELSSQPVRVVLRNERTGSPLTFQQVVMAGGDYRQDVSLQDSYISVAKTVAADPAAISFAGTMYMLRGVRAVPIGTESGQPFVAVDSVEADAGQYPLMRPQHMIVKFDPKTQLSDVQKEFMKYVFSQMGQDDVIKAGFEPVAAAPAKIALEQVGLNSLN